MPGQRGDDVAWAGGVAVRHVLGGRNDDGQVDWQRHFCRGLERAEDAGGAAHVIFHLVHVGARFERNASRVESDAFADQHDGRCIFLAAAIVQHDQARALGRTTGDGKQRVHAEFGHGVLFENVTFELVFLGQGAGCFRQIARMADVAWQVGEVAGE